MLYIHTIGRIGKDCQVIEGTHGSFIAFDMAVDDFSHGNAVTTWVRVRSNKENHIRLSEYLTKGRMVLVGGTLSTSLWKDKNGDSQIQLSITADALEFINTGKRKVQPPKPTARPQLPITHQFLRRTCHRTGRKTFRSDIFRKTVTDVVFTNCSNLGD